MVKEIIPSSNIMNWVVKSNETDDDLVQDGVVISNDANIDEKQSVEQTSGPPSACQTNVCHMFKAIPSELLQ